MDTLLQNRIAISVSLAGFVQRVAENDLLPKILPALGNSATAGIKKRIATELAIGVVACANVPDRLVLWDVWGMEGESLRQMIAMLVLSESNDSRQVLDNAKYSSSPDEARLQALLAVVRLTGVKDDTLITRLNTEQFGKEWNGLVADFVGGTLTGFRRAQRAAILESIAGKLESLTPRGNAIIEELVKRFEEVPDKPQDNASRLLAPDSRAQILYNAAIKKADELRDQINTMMGLPPMDLPEFQKMNEGMRLQWLSYCVPYATTLIFLSQIKKDAYFFKSDEFTVVYGQSILRIVQLEKALAAHEGFQDKFDQQKSQTSAQKLMGELEGALLYFVDFYKKVPFPDAKMLDFLATKIGVPEDLHSEFTWKLREFNNRALAEFAKL
jgi:hypothetical protein